MSGEREITTNQRQDEMAVLARYANQEGVPYDLVHENFELNPFDDFFDEYFKDGRERVLYTFASMFYRSMPRNDMDLEAPKFVGFMEIFKNNLENSSEMMSMSEAFDSISIVDENAASNFFAFMHGKYLGQAMAEFEADEFLGDEVVTRLVYWSRLDRIAREAIDRLTPEIQYEVNPDTL